MLMYAWSGSVAHMRSLFPPLSLSSLLFIRSPFSKGQAEVAESAHARVADQSAAGRTEKGLALVAKSTSAKVLDTASKRSDHRGQAGTTM